MSKRAKGAGESPTRLAAWHTAAGVRPFWLAAIGGLTLLAFRGLWIAPTRYDVDALLFLPGGLPTLAVIALSGWMLFGRLELLARSASPKKTSSVCVRLRRSAAFASACVGTLVFFWASRTGKVDLLLPALAAFFVAAATGWGGARGLRAIGLPAFVLLLGIRLPKPLEDEFVWLLQRWTADSAGWLLELVGRQFNQSGVILHDAEHSFHVIDSCSGMNGIGILVLIALVARELFREAGLRVWFVVAAAPMLAFLLNVVRVAVVAASPDPEKLAGIGGDHTPQGLAVLMLGTVLLYGLGSLLARGRHGIRSRTPLLDPDGGGEENHDASGIADESGRLVVAFTLMLCALALASFLIPRFPPPPSSFQRVVVDFPESKDGWTSIPAPHEPLFTGVFARGFHRRYQIAGGPYQAPEIVDVLVGYEDPSLSDSTRLFSSKALLPGPDWQLENEHLDRIWALDREIEWASASRLPGSERALVHVWRPGDFGLWRESWRALLGMEMSPWHRARPRALVRLVVYARHDGALALDRSKQRLDRFVVDFRDELQAL